MEIDWKKLEIKWLRKRRAQGDYSETDNGADKKEKEIQIMEKASISDEKKYIFVVKHC